MKYLMGLSILLLELQACRPSPKQQRYTIDVYRISNGMSDFHHQMDTITAGSDSEAYTIGFTNYTMASMSDMGLFTNSGYTSSSVGFWVFSASGDTIKYKLADSTINRIEMEAMKAVGLTQ